VSCLSVLLRERQPPAALPELRGGGAAAPGGEPMMVEGAVYAAWVLEELFYDEEMVAIDEAYRVLQAVEELRESAIDHDVFRDLE